MLTGILGAFRAGLVAVPVSTMFTGAELGKIMADSGARGRARDPGVRRRRQRRGRASPDVEHAVLAGEATAAAVPDRVAGAHLGRATDAGRARRRLRDVAPTGDDSWALWLYTSGTTGLPKAAMHRHANIRHVCETYGAQVLGITPGGRRRSRSPRCSSPTASATRCSSRSPWGRRPSSSRGGRRPDVVRERLEQTRPTLFFGVPTFYAALTAERRSGRGVRVGADVRVGGGAAAGAAAATVHRPVRGGDPRRHRLDRGAAHLPVQPARRHPARHDRGRRAGLRRRAPRRRRPRRSPDGEPGALHVRGESIALGYWHRTDASRQVFQGEWLVTGDTYVRNDEGYYICLGRNSDMLKAGGIWVSPGRGGEPAAGAPAGARGGGGRRRRRRRPRQAGRGGRRGRRRRRERPGGLVPRRARALQGAAAGGVRRPSCPKTATGKLQRFKVRDLVSEDARSPIPHAELGSGTVVPVTTLEVDILIVGAGPVGLYGAYYAGVRGLSVAVVDSLSARSAARSPRCTRRSRSTTSPASPRSPAGTWCAASPRRRRSATRRTCSGRRPQQLEQLDDGRLPGHHQTGGQVAAGAVDRHRRHRHVHAAPAAGRRGVPRPRPGVLRAQQPGVRRPRRGRSSAAATAPSTGR